MRQPPTASSPHGKGICRLLGDLLLREWRQRRLQLLRVPGMRLRHRLRIARHASTAAACGSAASIASNDAAHSWQHVLGLHALAALAKVQGPSTAGAIFRTLDTAAFSAAAADAPLVAPAEFAAATARRHLSHACQLWMEGHRCPGREGSIQSPALDGLLCDGWPRPTVGGAV